MICPITSQSLGNDVETALNLEGLSDATILVTGGAGFIGSHTIEYLLRETKARVVCLDNFCRTYSPRLKQANVAGFRRSPRVDVVVGSFTNQRCLDDLFSRFAITHLVHLGAHAGVRLSERFPKRFHAVNVVGSSRLLAVAARRQLRRVVLMSSSAVYGSGASLPFSEEGPWGIALSPYAESKRAMEAEALAHQRQDGLPVVILRPFSVYGPRLRPDLSMHVFGRRILQGKPIMVLGDGGARRDWTHVDDVTRAIHAGLVAPAAVGKAINIAGGQAWRIDQMISLLAEALGRSAQLDFCKPHTADMPATAADLRRATFLLNYRPQIALTEGIATVARWLQATERMPKGKHQVPSEP
jgi:nucleoside-diphosphate-sugar epimerase